MTVSAASKVPPDEMRGAPRYPARVVVRYRSADEGDWFTGATRNVSASGVLFERDPAEHVLQVDQRIEMELLMPSEIVRDTATRVMCVGHVSRVSSAGWTRSRACAAVTIERYRSLHEASSES